MSPAAAPAKPGPDAPPADAADVPLVLDDLVAPLRAAPEEGRAAGAAALLEFADLMKRVQVGLLTRDPQNEELADQDRRGGRLSWGAGWAHGLGAPHGLGPRHGPCVQGQAGLGADRGGLFCVFACWLRGARRGRGLHPSRGARRRAPGRCAKPAGDCAPSPQGPNAPSPQLLKPLPAGCC
jgi:hypothetical protein